MELVKDIAAVVGCIAACIGLTVTIFKPIRKVIVDGITNKQKETETNRKLDNALDMIQSVRDDVDQSKKVMLADIADFKSEMKNDVAQLKTDITNLNNRVNKIGENVLENEIDRLKSDLFNCGNRCRRGIPLHPEEFSHIREVYNKYNIKLKQNHEGTLEFEYILSYYNSQNLSNTN